MQGLVVKSTGLWCRVKGENSVLINCRIRGKLRLDDSKNTNPVAVGDRVCYEAGSEANTGIITGLKERKNYMIRKSTNLSRQSHILAANIDRAFLLATVVMPRTSAGFVDRFLVTAEAYGIPASIVFNKTDLYESKDRAEMGKWKAIYKKIGYSCFEVSALKGEGTEELKTIMQGKTNLLSGHSGVGKSSLLNALGILLKQKTGKLSGAHWKGIHTTTSAELFELPSGGAVIDTPGIKEFGMFDMKREEISHFFPEMRVLFNECRYNSCLHINELLCAVKQEVEKGGIAESRYQSYLGIMNGTELDIKY